MSEHSDEIAGHRVLRQIGYDGAGGFGLGCLYEAVDRAGRHVALKVASVEALPQVVVKSHNRHPALTELLGFWVVAESGRVIDDALHDVARYAGQRASLVFATPLPEGEPIRDRGASAQPPELLHHMGRLAAGIDFLTAPKHIAGIGDVALHSFEVSPADIRLTRAGAVFDDIGADVYYQVGTGLGRDGILGNPRYMAPERFAGTSCPGSVLYSFAVAYHELRTGVLPFGQVPDTFAGLIAARLENRLDLSRLPKAERPVVQTALSTDPARRHGSCAELVQNLLDAARQRRWWRFWR
jgi:serine/threonine protein kinase